MMVVTEGVETEGVYEQLVELSCDAVQGHFVNRPAPAADVARWLGLRAPFV